MKAMAAPPPICAPRKKRVVFRRSIPLQRKVVILATSQPDPNPSMVERTKPQMTFIHSSPLMPAAPPIAIAAPESPAMRAWLSLVGIPKYQAATAQMTIEKSAAQSATSAWWESWPKSTML